MRRFLGLLCLLAPVYCQDAPPPRPPATAAPSPPPDGRFDEVLKAVDDLNWQTKLGDIADVDKVEYSSLPPHHATPLLIHSNTIDEDVNVLEVQHLIDSLKAAGKKFEYKIYEAAPGGHRFNRTDTKLAKDSRREVYAFLANYLNPAK
jgi:Prolyl oligopeptidase family